MSVKKLALLFPGQGSQYVGMGEKLKSFTQGQERLNQVDQVLGFSLSKLMSEGPEEELKLTQNTQPAITCFSYALWDQLKNILKNKNLEVDFVLGHSVGEYAALAAVESITFEDAINAVHARGRYMQEAVPVGAGKMIAILKIPLDEITDICQKVSTPDAPIMPANYNGPDQTVVSGSSQGAENLITWLKENYPSSYRAIELPVSAPFHSSLMAPARLKMEEKLKSFTLSPNKIPYLANIDAEVYPAQTSAGKIVANLVAQVDGPVYWTQSIAKLPDQTLCLEVGPGKVLTGMVKKINPSLHVFNLDQEAYFSNPDGFIEGLLKEFL